MEVYLKISDFAKAVGRHANTVDNWFKALEEKRVHYVSRVSGEKVYDQLDLEIAEFIRDKRDDKWNLEGIFNILPEQFELRPFPEDETTSVPHVLDMDAIIREIKAAAQQIASAQIEEVKQQYETIIRQLPKPLDPMEEKQRRVTDIITQRRVVSRLEEEALAQWSMKPPQERMKPAGLFRKVEDTDKRDAFVGSYVNEHLERRLASAYGLDDSVEDGSERHDDNERR